MARTWSTVRTGAIKRLAILSIGVGLTATACATPSTDSAQAPAHTDPAPSAPAPDPTLTAADATLTAAGMPDVKVVSVTPSQVTLNAKVAWSAVVQNVGTAPTPYGVAVGVLFTVDNETVHTWGWTTTRLAAGAKATISGMGGNVATTWTSAKSGTHTVHAFVDDVNRFGESNESNNKLDATFNVGTTTTTMPTPSTTVAPPTTNNTPIPTAVTTRDLRTWPFASTSPWNMPRGDGAAFDGRQVASGGNINSANGWGVSVAGAGSCSSTRRPRGTRTTKDTSRSSVPTA